MKILYITFSCNPYGGSEDSIGWNIPFQIAKYGHDVLVITKEEQREYIDKYFLNNEKMNNLKFKYINISSFYKKIFSNSFYSGRLNIWHKNVFRFLNKQGIAKHIDLIHVITPVEFRSLGDYYKFTNCKIVVGPIGGGEYMAKSHYKYLSIKEKVLEKIRIMLNFYYKKKLKFKHFFKKIDFCYFANYETRDYLSDIVECKYAMFTDVGVDKKMSFSLMNKDDKKYMNLAVVGRLHYRKGHLFLLDALKKVNIPKNVRIVFVGDGKKRKALENKILELKLCNIVSLVGNIPYEQMDGLYSKIDILLLPSLRETGGVVLAEAICRNIPIITSRSFGSRLFLNDSNSLLFDITNIDSFCKVLTDVFENNINLSNIKKNESVIADSILWENKAKLFVEKYEELIK